MKAGDAIATRYLPATAVMLALTLVPTVVHTYVGLSASDGKTSAIVALRLNGVNEVETGRHVEWVRESFGTDDFIERRYGPDVTLFVARSYDPKRLYHHPELAVAYGRRFDSASVIRLSTPVGVIPMHVLSGEDELACYALLYDGRFVESPLRFEMSHALGTLIGPRKQMTLFFAHGRASATPADSEIARILVGAIQSFLTQPVTGSR